MIARLWKAGAALVALSYPTLVNAQVGTAAATGGEIQLTDAMAKMIGDQPFHAVTFDGKRYDCGSKLGFVEATLALALQREDLADSVREIAQRILSE